MEYDAFRTAVLGLSRDPREQARLTKGAVALRLGLQPAAANAMLDRMTRDGDLELDVDERSGEIFYEVRTGHRAPIPQTPPAGAKARDSLARINKAVDGGAALAQKLGTKAALAIATGAATSSLAEEGARLPPEKRRKLAVGVLLGGLFPGFGLAYAAPWPVVVASSIGVAVGFKLIALIPFLSAFLMIPFLSVCAIASAALGGLYTWQYNQTGRRTPLGDKPLAPVTLLKRLRK